MAEAGSAEPGKPPPVASLERALDQVVDFLSRVEQTSRVRALVIEARRLRNIVGNWRSIAPPDDVREEMIARVLRLANDAEEISGADRQDAQGADAEEEVAPHARRATPFPEQVGPDDTAGPPRVMTLTGPPIPGLPSPEMQAAAQQPDLDLEMPGHTGGTLPFPSGGEQTDVNRFGGAGDRSLDGPTQAMHAVPDLPPHLWDDLQQGGDPQRPPDLGSLPPIQGEPLDLAGETLVAPRGLDGRGAEPSPQSLSGGPPTLPRVPSLQFARLPAPAAPLDAGRALLPESAYVRGPAPIAPAAPPTPEIIEGPPSLRIDREEPPSSSRWDSEKTLTAIPVASFAIQPISVWSVPRPEEVDPELVMLSDPYSKRADAYRALRRKLASGTARIIAVTSAMPKEGKTTAAINLAVALAETSPRNVLLVEANIRSPGLAAALKFNPPTCFAEQLRKRRKDPMEPWVVVEQTAQSDAPPPSQSSTRGRLHLLAMDPHAQRPPLLDGVSFSDGVQSLKRAGYEYIVLDTPPVMESVDMNVIGDSVDGVILTSLVKKTTRKGLRQAIEQLKPAPVLGVVVLER